jgi:hypothetical protein
LQVPIIMPGVQELLVYFDPWLSWYVFPVVYTLGFAVIPFLVRATGRDHAGRDTGFSIVIAFFLIAFEAVWLLLAVVGLFLRGSNWSLFSLDEPWDPSRVMPLNMVNLSDIWVSLGYTTFYDAHWAIREGWGFLLLAAYFVIGMLIARLLCRATHGTTPYWRWALLFMLLQIAALVPIKMFLRSAFNLRYVIWLPEYFLNV